MVGGGRFDGIATADKNRCPISLRLAAQLIHQPGLANARLAQNNGYAHRVARDELVQLGGRTLPFHLAPNHLRLGNGGMAIAAHLLATGLVHLHRLRFALEHGGWQGGKFEFANATGIGGFVTQDGHFGLVFGAPRQLHQAGGEVDRIANHGVFAPGFVADGAAKDQARGHADSSPQASLFKFLLKGQGGADASLRVVFVGKGGQAEGGHKGHAFVVYVEFVDAPFVAIGGGL